MGNEFSQRMSELLSLSKEEATRLRSKSINPEHLLLGILRQGKSCALDILSHLNVNIQDIKNTIESRSMESQPADIPYDNDIEMSLGTARILRFTTLEARILKAVADSEHLLLGILKEKNNLAANILEENNITYSQVLDAIKEKMPDNKNNISNGFGYTDHDDEEETLPGNNSGNSRPQTDTNQAKPSNETPALDNFGVDMTKAAREGKLDPVVGREKEIERISQILSRRKKNNPILIGEPGVGKSAIVEGLAQRIVERKTSRILFDKRIIALDIAYTV